MFEVKTVAVRPCYREKWQGLRERKGGRDMTEKVKLTGRCMCGAVEISGVADGPKAQVVEALRQGRIGRAA